MKDVFLLTNILTKSSNNSIKQNNENRSKSISRILLILIAYLYLGIVMGVVSNIAISSLMTIGMENIFIYLIFCLFYMFIMMQTIISSINVLYFSKDLEFLMPLPIKPVKIIMAKINYMLINTYLVSLTLVVPGLIVFGYLKNLALGYYLMSLVNVIFFPVIPILIIVFIVTVIMKPLKKIISREMLQYISFIFTFILIIAVQKVSNITETSTTNQIAESLIGLNNMIKSNVNIFFNVDFVYNSIINFNNLYGVCQLGTFIVLTVFVYYFGCKIISRTYSKTITTASTTKKKIDKVQDSDYIESSVNVSYTKKEFSNLFRNPIFFIQCVFFGIIFPIMFLMIGITNMNTSGVDPELFLSDVSNVINSTNGIVAILFLFVFCFLFNYVSVTAVSREGHEYTFTKYIPIPLDKQIKLKATPGIIVNNLIMIAIVIGLFLVVRTVTLTTIILALTLGVLLNRFNNILLVIIDLKNPKLKWISEYAVVKQNINMIYQMLIYSVEMAVLGVLLTKMIDLKIFVAISALCLISINVIIDKYIKIKQNKLFKKIV